MLIDADIFMNELNESQQEFDEYYKGLGRAKTLLLSQPEVDVESVIRAHWELRYEDIENDDGWTHNRCSHCKHDAVFYPTFSEDWDEDIDGEWMSLGTFQDGIEEFLTDFCPFCGATMDELNEEKVIE